MVETKTAKIVKYIFMTIIYLFGAFILFIILGGNFGNPLYSMVFLCALALFIGVLVYDYLNIKGNWGKFAKIIKIAMFVFAVFMIILSIGAYLVVSIMGE